MLEVQVLSGAPMAPTKVKGDFGVTKSHYRRKSMKTTSTSWEIWELLGYNDPSPRLYEVHGWGSCGEPITELRLLKPTDILTKLEILGPSSNGRTTDL
jgi:hypothetical protein